MQPARRDIIGTMLGLAPATAAAAHANDAGTQPRPPSGPGAGEPLLARTPDGLTLSGRGYGDPSRPEILLVHGLGQSRLSWEFQTHGPLIERFRVAAFDLRGHGDSDKPDAVSAYADGAAWAADLRAMIQAAGLRRPVLVGWSLGGFAIGHYLARHGVGGIAGVNLVNAVTRLSPEFLSPAAQDFAGRLASPDLGARAEAIEGFLEACFAIRPSDAAFRRMLVFNGMVPRAVQQGIVRMSSDGLDEAFALPARVLVTYGAKDALTLPAMSRRVRALNARAELSIYEESGHTPFHEEPDRFNAELAAFASG